MLCAVVLAVVPVVTVKRAQAGRDASVLDLELDSGDGHTASKENGGQNKPVGEEWSHSEKLIV